MSRDELADERWQRLVLELLPIGSETPERYVAMHAHEWVLAGPLAYRYPDPVVDAYVAEVANLTYVSHEEMDTLRRRVLTPEEYTRLQVAIENFEF